MRLTVTRSRRRRVPRQSAHIREAQHEPGTRSVPRGAPKSDRAGAGSAASAAAASSDGTGTGSGSHLDDLVDGRRRLVDGPRHRRHRPVDRHGDRLTVSVTSGVDSRVLDGLQSSSAGVGAGSASWSASRRRGRCGAARLGRRRGRSRVAAREPRPRCPRSASPAWSGRLRRAAGDRGVSGRRGRAGLRPTSSCRTMPARRRPSGVVAERATDLAEARLRQPPQAWSRRRGRSPPHGPRGRHVGTPTPTVESPPPAG